jgi:hypothetical protein
VIKMHLHFLPRKIVQTRGLLLISFERDTAYRHIFTDGRPDNPQPSFNGYSTGKWEGIRLSSRRTVSVTARGWIVAALR